MNAPDLAARPIRLRLAAGWKQPRAKTFKLRRQGLAGAERKEFPMKMSSDAIEQTLTQFEADPLPDDHPAVEQLNKIFGDHTYFLDPNGLHIVETAESTNSGSQQGVVIKLASWSDKSRTSLAPHPPEPTNMVIELKAA
jgi:hypothetical protein